MCPNHSVEKVAPLCTEVCGSFELTNNSNLQNVFYAIISGQNVKLYCRITRPPRIRGPILSRLKTEILNVENKKPEIRAVRPGKSPDFFFFFVCRPPPQAAVDVSGHKYQRSSRSFTKRRTAPIAITTEGFLACCSCRQSVGWKSSRPALATTARIGAYSLRNSAAFVRHNQQPTCCWSCDVTDRAGVVRFMTPIASAMGTGSGGRVDQRNYGGT